MYFNIHTIYKIRENITPRGDGNSNSFKFKPVKNFYNK